MHMFSVMVVMFAFMMESAIQDQCTQFISGKKNPLSMYIFHGKKNAGSL